MATNTRDHNLTWTHKGPITACICLKYRIVTSPSFFYNCKQQKLSLNCSASSSAIGHSASSFFARLHVHLTNNSHNWVVQKKWWWLLLPSSRKKEKGWKMTIDHDNCLWLVSFSSFFSLVPFFSQLMDYH